MNTLLSNLASFFSSLFRRGGANSGSEAVATAASEPPLEVEALSADKPAAAPVSAIPLEEECRLALLRSPTGELTGNLAKRVSAEVSDAEVFLAPLRAWAERGRMFRVEADAMVARGEDKTGFGFDSLKRDVRAHIDGVFSDDRRLSAAWFMLKPFFFEPVPPAEAPVPVAPSEEAKPTTAAPESPAAKIPTKKFLLAEILKFASWDGPDGAKALAEAFRMLEKHYPEAVGDGKRNREKGRQWKVFKERARKAGASGKPLNEVLSDMKAAGFADGYHQKLAEKAFASGENARKKYFQVRQLEKKAKKAMAKADVAPGKAPAAKNATTATVIKVDEPASNAIANPFAQIANGHANALPSLAPASSWTVLVDETGSNFSSGAAGKTRGRMVAVFVPGSVHLPDLPKKWHAVETGELEGENGVLDLVGRLQSAKCGVLGIPVTVLPETTEADQWFSCVEDLLSLGFRLLPVDGPAKISLFVEQRGFASGPTGTAMLSKTVEDVLHRLARVFPERARKLSVESRIVSKDEHPWNGYVDAAAWTWIGTVTPKPQVGNPKPRPFRLPEQQAIVNRMGFNNHGIDSVLANIRRSKYDGILGINIGKNATTPIENAVDDYLICLKKAYELASYITINISSPNTKNLRSLQGEDELNQLLAAIKFCQNDLANQHNKYVPIALKIAPDLDENQIVAIAKAVRYHQIDGVIATNTTVDKSSLGNHPLSNEAGGLSGSPLKNKANEVLSILSKHLNPPNEFAIPIIGVGGISSGEDAVEKLQKGANAVQIYSGLIYQGPQLVRECVHFIQKYQSQK